METDIDPEDFEKRLHALSQPAVEIPKPLTKEDKAKLGRMSQLAELDVVVAGILVEEGPGMQEWPELQGRLRELNGRYEPAPVYKCESEYGDLTPMKRIKPTREIEWYADGGAGIKRHHKTPTLLAPEETTPP